jgi:hypothetical protein
LALYKTYKNEELKAKIFKSSILSSFRNAVGFSIILLIIFFAIIYHLCAGLTRGEAYDYNKKTIMNKWQTEFARSFPQLPYKVYRNLAKHYENTIEGGLNLTSFTDPVSGIKTITSDSKDDEIGAEWSDFYKELFIKEGATHYRIDRYKNNTGKLKTHDFYNLSLYKIDCLKKSAVEGEWSPVVSGETYNITNHGSPFREYVILLPKKMTYISSDTFTGLNIQVNDKDKVIATEIYGNVLLTLDSLSFYLTHSNNYPDNNSIVKVHKIITVRYLDSFIDYLYFSISNIFKAGYTEFTPIDPKVRLLTIIEAVIGWFMLLLFGSLLVTGLQKS